MRKVKAVAAVAVTLFVSLFLSSCGLFGGDLISPPEPAGEMRKIKAAIEDTFKGKITFKYPTSGDYRSAVILHDLTGNGIDDATVFFTRAEDGETAQYIAIVTDEDGEWRVLTPQKVSASGIEKVCFCDLNGDKTDEIAVGWNVLGSAQKQIAVYSIKNGAITQHFMENYNEFVCCDLDTNDKNEIFVLDREGTAETAAARLFTLDDGGSLTVDNCISDGKILSYTNIALGKLLGGKPCIYVDGTKSTGTVTQVFFLQNGKLCNPIYDNMTLSADRTLRKNGKASTDADGDLIYEIPLSEELKTPEGGGGYELICFCNFDGEKLAVTQKLYYFGEDIFKFTVPKAVSDNLYISYDGSKSVTSFYYLNDNGFTELCRVKISETAQTEMQKCAQNGKEKLYVSISENPFVSKEDLISAFSNVEENV